MSHEQITRTTCDRCGHLWEGIEEGSSEIYLKCGFKNIIGCYNHTSPSIFSHLEVGNLCKDCTLQLIPWLGRKK